MSAGNELMRDSALKRFLFCRASVFLRAGNELMRDSALKPLHGLVLRADDELAGNELMRDSALKPAACAARRPRRRLLEMSSCATAL